MQRVFPVRREELSSALLMTAYFFLAMSCVSIVKALQSALYLGRVGFDYRLPLIYVTLALISGPVVWIYRSCGRRYSHIHLSIMTLFLVIASLAGLYLLITAKIAWSYPAFYLWGGIFSVLLPMLGWVISYGLYTTRQAKRVFALLGTGGILGGIAGGYYTALAVGSAGTEALLLHVGLLLALLLGVLFLVRSRYGEKIEERSAPSSGPGKKVGVETLRELFRSPYLAGLAWLILTTGAVTTLIDINYKWLLEQRFTSSEEEITQFFGGLLGTVFVFSALFQFFVTSRLLRSLGVGAALLVLPFGLLSVSLGVFVAPLFWAAVGMRLVDGGLRNSIHRTSVELLYVPISGPDTVADKSFIDLVVYRSGDALGAALFLAVALTFDMPPAAIAALVGLGALLWIGLANRMGKGYLEVLRKTLEVTSGQGSRRALQLDEAVAEQTLLSALESENPSKVHFALHQLSSGLKEDWHGEEGYDASGEALLQSQAAALGRPSEPHWLQMVESLLEHPDRRVSSLSLSVMVRYRPESYGQILRDSLQAPQIPSERHLHFLDNHVREPKRFLDPVTVLNWCRQADERRSVILSRLMAKSEAAEFRAQLEEWAQGERSARTKAAIEALGAYDSDATMEKLLGHLSRKWSRRPAGKALARFGDRIVNRLVQKLRDPEIDLQIRREIPLILARINTTGSRSGLVAALYLPDAIISYRSLKGLNKIRDDGDLSYNQASFLPALQMWARQYYGLLNLEMLLRPPLQRGRRLLRAAVDERMDWTIEKIFRALGLFFPMGEAYFSYRAYIGKREELRANAVELIESRMPGELRKTLLPIFSEGSRRSVLAHGRRIYGLPVSIEEIFAEALFDRDPWLKCCILAAIAQEGRDGFENVVKLMTQDIQPEVRDTAHWVLEVWRSGVETQA